MQENTKPDLFDISEIQPSFDAKTGWALVLEKNGERHSVDVKGKGLSLDKAIEKATPEFEKLIGG